MQTSTQAPTAAPATPAAPATFTMIGADGKPQTLPIPRTREEIRVIQAQRDQISEQLDNVSSRRSDIAGELAGTAADAAKTGLEQRLQILDQRILQLENDLARTGQQLAAAPPELVASTEPARAQDNNSNDFGSGFTAGGFSVAGLVVVLLLARRRWKGPSSPRSPRIEADSAQRLQRLEHGMDAIAIEIERVSEGQRFVTKLLSESLGPTSTPQRVAQPASVQSSDPSER